MLLPGQDHLPECISPGRDREDENEAALFLYAGLMFIQIVV
jgi:hypothetical protein